MPGGWSVRVTMISMPGGWSVPITLVSMPGGWSVRVTLISMPGGWPVRVTLISMPGDIARRLRYVHLMLLSWYRSKVISIRVLSLDNYINVDHELLHKSKKVFKFAFLVGTLRAYSMKSIIIIRLWPFTSWTGRHSFKQFL